MPEIHQPLLPVETHYICDSCGTGTMKRASRTLETVSNKGFSHTCDYCDTEAYLQNIYPQTNHVNFYGFLKDAQQAIQQAANNNDERTAE